jgi:ABC-type spermidine/putrescine transport system permease subunit I
VSVSPAEFIVICAFAGITAAARSATEANSPVSEGVLILIVIPFLVSSVIYV